MRRIKTPEERAYRHVRGCLLTYIAGGKWTKDKKPQSLNWMIGVIKADDLPREDLERLFASTGVQNYPTDDQARRRLQAIKDRCVELGWLSG